MAGYSGRSLPEKLGIRPETQVIALSAPRSYRSLLGALPKGATIGARLPPSARFIHCFTRSRKHLERRFPRLASALTDDGTLWVSWPKKASGMETDLTEDVLREIGLAQGLVDVKVCAVDDVWSALKFVRRAANRGVRT